MSNANANHKANQANANKGTPGQNTAYSKVHGNRGAQLNPNNNLKIPILIKIEINFFS